MKDEQEWQKFMSIAGLHIVWRHPLVRVVRMSVSPQLRDARYDLLFVLCLGLARKFGPDWRSAYVEEYIRVRIVRPVLRDIEQYGLAQGLPGIHYGFHADGQHDAQLPHQPRTGDAHGRQCMGLPGARPGTVEADAKGGFFGVHGRTIPVPQAKAI